MDWIISFGGCVEIYRRVDWNFASVVMLNLLRSGTGFIFPLVVVLNLFGGLLKREKELSCNKSSGSDFLQNLHWSRSVAWFIFCLLQQKRKKAR